MNRTDIPAPLYAAAGAGELAYEQLRRLPEVAARTAAQLRQRLAVPERDLTADLARLRESAQRGTATLAARAVTVQERMASLPERAAAAQDRAAAGYQRLVVRGERVLADRIGVANGPATGRTAPTGIEVEVGPVEPAPRPATTRKASPGRPRASRPAG